MVFELIKKQGINNFKRLVNSLFIKKKVVPNKPYNSFDMATVPNLLQPPDNVCGITELSRELFRKDIEVACLNVKGVKLSTVIPTIKKYLLKLEHFKPIRNLSVNETIIYLNPQLVKTWTDLSVEDQKSLQSLSLNENSIEVHPYTLTYENFSVENVLKSILPKGQEGLSSFTKIGHIVHVNLREHLMPYKKVIGEVLFDKVAGCRTVVNKIDMIDNTYRNFKMEVLKGVDDMLAQVKENKCTFEFDFSKVYWNSRLCTEHERIVKMLKPGDVLFDVFAGVGPFSIPASKKNCIVYSNDLNPESFNWLNHNVKINKINQNNFRSYNKDGKDFILEEIKENLPKYLNKNNVYIAMNLPAMAVEFLKNFVSLYEEIEEITQPPIVIVYCFAKGEDPESIAKNLLFHNIGCDISDKIVDIFKVRTVSSLKEMMRITFKLDRDILVGNILKSSFGNKRKIESSDDEIVKKRQHGEKQEEN